MAGRSSFLTIETKKSWANLSLGGRELAEWGRIFKGGGGCVAYERDGGEASWLQPTDSARERRAERKDERK
jgi:hypothetical protein